MDPSDLPTILLRWSHIIAAITLGGGLIYQRIAVVGIADTLTDDAKAAARRNWSRTVAIATLFLLASGLVNLVLTIKAFKGYDPGLPSAYHAMFGVKFLLALGVFFLASILAGKSENAQKFQANAKRWLNISIVLVVVIVCLSGVLRQRRIDTLEENIPDATAPAESGA